MYTQQCAALFTYLLSSLFLALAREESLLAACNSHRNKNTLLIPHCDSRSMYSQRSSLPTVFLRGRQLVRFGAVAAGGRWDIHGRRIDILMISGLVAAERTLVSLWHNG